MELLSQTILDHLAAFTEIPQAPSGNGDSSGKDFDALVSGKRQDVKDEPKSEKPGAPEKDDPPVSEKPQDSAKPRQEEETRPTDNQYGVAASILLQGQPDQRTVELIQTAPVETAAVETAVATVAEPVQVAPESVVQVQQAQSQTQAPQAAETPTQAPADVPRAIQDVPKTQPQEAPPQTVTETPRETVQAPVQQQPEVVKEAVVTAQPSEQLAQAPQEEEIQAGNVEIQTPEAPLFKDVEAAPVKVADPEPVPLESQDGAEKLAKAVVPELNAGDTKVELTLTPANLGKVTVEITHSVDGAIHVALSASTRVAEKLLEQHAGNLQDILAASGREDVKVEVQSNQPSQQQPQFLNPDGQNRQEQQEEQQRQQQNRQPQKHETEDFIQQLRLGLVSSAQA